MIIVINLYQFEFINKHHLTGRSRTLYKRRMGGGGELRENVSEFQQHLALRAYIKNNQREALAPIPLL